MNELTPGTTIRGKYEIVDRIGAGGMAVVYRARHLAFGEIFAIKVVSALLADNEELLTRFRNEAIITRRLRHPNAVRVDDLDATEDGRPFILMEYVDGHSLRQVMSTQGAIPVPRALSIARQAASALAAAHELGIVHRDIKPDNILLVPQKDGTDVVKVLDFGIAKVREGTIALTDGYTPTQTGIIIGTPQYISPEQALGMRGDDLDGRADIYALGVVLYEMLTGELPFHSDTPMGMMLHHIQSPPRPPRQVRSDLPIAQTLSDVTMKALAKDPGRRFQSAAELVQALGRSHEVPMTAAYPAAKAAPGPAASKPAPPRSATPSRVRIPQPPEPIASERRSSLPMNPTLLSAGAVGLLLLGFVVFWPSLPERKSADPGPRPPSSLPPVAAVTIRDSATPHADSTEAVPDDASILAEVGRQLSASEELKGGAAIEAVVEDGVVTLSGKGTATQIELATALAKSVRGVKDVRSSVETEVAAVVDPRVEDLVNDAYSLLENGKTDDAIAKFSAALELDPTYASARLGLQRAKAKVAGH